MQELRLYDPDRRPRAWTDIIRPGQYAVFHSDLRTDVEKRPDGRFLLPGEESSCLLFDSLAGATVCFLIEWHWQGLRWPDTRAPKCQNRHLLLGSGVS